MAKMIPIQPAIRIVLKAAWTLVASEAGRYAHGLRPTIGLWNDGTLCEAESFSLADGKIRQAFAALVANRMRGYAQTEVEHKLLELFTALEGRLRDRPTHSAYSPATAEAHEPALPYSDFTNALEFVRDHGHILRYCYAWKSWLVWTGTHWERDTSGRVMTLAKQTIKRLARQVEHLRDEEASALLKHIKTSLATTKLKALIECAQDESGIPVQPEALDADPWRIVAHPPLG